MNTDPITRQYLEAIGCGDSFRELASDEGAIFCQSLDFSADSLSPMLACPHQVDNVVAVGEAAKGIAIDQAYIGSCTGGRYTDLAQAARLLRGKKVKSGCRLLVSPASQNVWLRADRDGILKILAEAGAMILAPTCGVCVGLHSGALADGERCISSTNRNFLGRMGSKKAESYLASPLTVAAAAVAGEIIDPRELL